MPTSKTALATLRAWLMPGSLVLVLVAVVIATALGSVAVGFDDILRALHKGVSGETLRPLENVVFNLRIPRVLLAGLVGAALSVAGTVYQGVFRNPLADPYLLGAASGAGFGAVLAMTVGAAVPWVAALGPGPVAFVFALLSVATVLLSATSASSLPTIRLILAGVVVGSLFSAGTSFMLVAEREQVTGMLSWLLGGFGFSNWQRVTLMAAILVPVFLVVRLAARALDLLQLGEEGAALLGLGVDRTKLLLLAVATLLTAAAVSVAGIIGFVGLIVPHAVRLALGPAHARLLPVAALWGAAFLILADLLARHVIAPVEVPVGIVTALVGGPLFLVLLRRSGL